MSIHNNLDTGTICLRQADATVLSRRGSYFYFSMRAVKASQNKQTQVKLLLLFFRCSLPLALWENSTAPVHSREPSWGDAVPKDSCLLMVHTCLYGKYIFLITHGKPARPYMLYISVFWKAAFLKDVRILCLCYIVSYPADQLQLSYDSPSSGGVNFEQLHILTK